MWNNINVNLGVLHPKDKKKIEYVYTGNIKVLTIEASCGCIDPTWDEKTNTLRVSYVAPKLPSQVIDLGRDSMKQTQSINLRTITEGKEKLWVLYFRAEIKKH